LEEDAFLNKHHYPASYLFEDAEDALISDYIFDEKEAAEYGLFIIPPASVFIVDMSGVNATFLDTIIVSYQFRLRRYYVWFHYYVVDLENENIDYIEKAHKRLQRESWYHEYYGSRANTRYYTFALATEFDDEDLDDDMLLDHFLFDEADEEDEYEPKQ